MLTVKIINDGTGDIKVGHYDYEVAINNTVLYSGRVGGFNRRKLIQGLLEAVADDVRYKYYSEISEACDAIFRG